MLGAPMPAPAGPHRPLSGRSPGPKAGGLAAMSKEMQEQLEASAQVLEGMKKELDKAKAEAASLRAASRSPTGSQDAQKKEK